MGPRHPCGTEMSSQDWGSMRALLSQYWGTLIGLRYPQWRTEIDSEKG